MNRSATLEVAGVEEPSDLELAVTQPEQFRDAPLETKPRDVKPALFAITGAHTSVDMHTGSLPILLPVLLTSFNLNYATAAAIVTANNVVIAIAQPLFGILGDAKSLRWMVWLGCALTGLAMTSVLWMPAYPLVIAAVLLSGIGSAMFHPEALTRARAVNPSQPATALSVFFSGGNVGFALGPILVTLLLSTFGRVGGLLMLVPTALGLVALASQWHAISAPRASTTVKKGEARAVSRWGLVAFLMLLITVRGTVSTGLQTFIPLFFRENGRLAPEAAALLVTVLSLSGVAGTLSGGVAADRYGRRVTMALSLVVSLVALYGFVHTEGLLRIIFVGISGAFISAAWPIIVAMIQEAMPSNPGLAGGLSLGTTYAASGLGVAALGAYADHTSISDVITILSLLPAAALILTAFVPERVKPTLA
jgi:MFS transporter, FSR family, fosmidomycin resistance protein